VGFCSLRLAERVLPHTVLRDGPLGLGAVSQFHDHSWLAVTTVYLRRLEGTTDSSWDKVAAAIGV